MLPKKKKIKYIIFVLVIYFGASLSLNNAEEKQMIKGTIYLGGEVFNKIDLNTKKWEVIYGGATSEGFRGFRYPNILNNDLLILCTGNKLIQYFSLKDKKFVPVTEGVKPVYVQEINSIFYYKYFYHNSKEGLFQKKLDGSGQEEFITDNIYGVLVKISPSEVAYYSKDKKIEIYNFINKTFRTIDITGYNPWAFYAKKNSFICREEDDKSFYFVNIATLEKEEINIKNPNLIKWCIIPVEDYNCLIYSKIRVVFIAEYEDMYIYWIDRKKEEKYLKNFGITSGVYLKD